MPLKYPAEWKFDDFGHVISDEANSEFFELVKIIAEGTELARWVYEDFKTAFGVDSVSSSANWAEYDLSSAMSSAKSNAARYVAAMYGGMELVKKREIDVPSVERINKILVKWNIPLIVAPPALILKTGDVEIVEAPVKEAEPSATAFIRGPVVGKGGFGVVYKMIRRTQIGDFDYAMKVLDPSPFVENKERAKARFTREMEALRKLQHRGIVPFLEAGFDSDQKPYILMPHIEGKNLRDALAGATLPTIALTFYEILLALQFAHEKGVIHRDLKPSNVIVRSSDSQPLILDFGCAYLIDEVDESLTTAFLGTSAYIPIEVHLNPKHRTAKQDVYACGVLLYEIIANKLPRPDNYEPIEGMFEGYDGIDAVIQGALSPEKDRIDSASKMGEMIADVATGKKR